jgi:hypothetical protein
MVLGPNAVIDPWTMMIKSFHASIADIAMSTPLCSDYLTIGTKVVSVEFLYYLEEVNVLIF